MNQRSNSVSGSQRFVYSQLTSSAELKSITRKLRSGDEVHVMIEHTQYSDERRLAILHVDYDTSDRVWFVKTWLGSGSEVNASSGHSELCDEAGEHIPAADCIRRHLAGVIRDSAAAVLSGNVFAY